MNTMTLAKRFFALILTLSALALCAIAAQPSNQPCPLPVTAASESNAKTQSPEQPACKRRVHHNGMLICLPCPAWEAHIRHGDADGGECDKPGNETPPGQN